MKTLLLFGVILAISTPTLASRTWEKYDVPGARCGDQKDYSVFVSRGTNPKKLAFDLMGGGACWNLSTCWGPTLMTWIHPLPRPFEISGFVSENPERSPAAESTIVYFPYCTGDVHLGSHVATYRGVEVHHVGKTNIEKSMEFLATNNVVEFRNLDEVILYGYSAGAIGSLYHIKTIDPYVSAQRKFLIADSPGLHFGADFWSKFPEEQVNEYERAIGEVGFHLNRKSGNLAKLIPALCHKFPDWRVAVLQGARDIVMSLIFGELTESQHEKMIYGPQGLRSEMENAPENCYAWIPRTQIHTFFVVDQLANAQIQGDSALQYVFRFLTN